MDRQALSPGWQTHLMFAAFDGEITDCGDHLAVRTPASPGYYWGNFLLFDRAPTDADFGPWMQDFDEAIVSRHPATGHRCFGVHAGAAGCVLPVAFARAGFTLFKTTTLLLRPGQLRALPGPLPPGLELRPLRLPQEADAAVALNMACNDQGYEPEGYRRFRQQQMQRYARMQQAGMGHWWGAWHGDDLCASLGLFGPADGQGPGRFQHVETHPAWRRRGLCRALVHAACLHGLQQRGWPVLVMGADPEDVAIGIYRSVGFEPHDDLWMLERRAPEDRAAA